MKPIADFFFSDYLLALLRQCKRLYGKGKGYYYL
jgi:hypothetical protein